ncbi:MAG: hypothetical protein ACRD3C_18670 [Vicinamibacterales bacterium]
MAIWDFLRIGRTASVRTPLTDTEVREMGSKFPFVRTWVCVGRGCDTRPPNRGLARRPATLTIRSEIDRSRGPSNYEAYPASHPTKAGHATLPSHMLNWNGLVEERGWGSNPVLCPACTRGLSVRDYKEQRRQGLL